MNDSEPADVRFGLLALAVLALIFALFWFTP